MGIPSETRDAGASTKESLVASSLNEHEVLDPKQSTTREAVLEGFKTAVIAGTVVAVPTLAGCRVIPWAKANLNYTAQALIISAAAISGFFITADKTIVENAKRNTIGKYEKRN